MPVRTFLARHGWLVAIALTYLYAFPYFPTIHSANELPRVYLVQAIVDDGTFAIDREVRQWGATADVSPSRGHQYSNKAPGSSLLVVPVYAAVRLVGGAPGLAATMWLCRIVAGVLPSLLFLIQLSGFLARRVHADVRRLVLLAYALGSMAMTYSLLFYSHQLAAICLASAWLLAIDVVEGRRRIAMMAAVGALAGAAPLVDYQVAFAGAPLTIYILVRLWQSRRSDFVRALVLAVAAQAIPIAMLLAYHAVCFGSPWRTGYDASQTFAHFHQVGFLGMTSPHATALWGSLFAVDNGLVALAPWLLVAIPGGVLLWRRGERGLVATCAAVAIVLVLFVSSINFWRGGWGVGPRYITAVLPFLLPLVAAALDAWRSRPLVLGAAAGTIVVGIVIYTLTSVTFPYWPDSLRDPLYEVTFRLLGDGAVAPNVATACGISGLLAIAPVLLVVAVVTGSAIVRVCSWRGLALAVVVATAIIAGYALVPHGGPGADRAYAQTVYPAVAR